MHKTPPKKRLYKFKKNFYKSRQLYLIVILPLIYLIVFCYLPMVGAQIAFRDFSPLNGIWGSKWVGLKYFEMFFKSYQFKRVIINTLILSAYTLVASFPLPIILAICINYVQNNLLKRSVQMITYAPYFISTVVLIGMINQFFSLRTGVFNNFLDILGGTRIDILNAENSFRSLYVWSGVWQMTGFSAIVYLAALTSIDPQLYEALRIDGGNIFQQIFYIDLPSILPTAIIMLILNCGNILNIGFEKVFLMQNPRNQAQSEIISTLVYKIGIKSEIPMYSYSTAIGLFTSVISLILLVSVNQVSKKIGETSIW